MSGSERDDFPALFAATGLNPEEHDLEALRDAVEKLGKLMERLDPGDPEGGLPLFAFDPTREI